MMDEKKEEWVIMRMPRSKELVVLRMYGLEDPIPFYPSLTLLARGFKSVQEARLYLPLYNEGAEDG
jgi:hypothetical protein